MEAFSALLAICAENSPVPGEFPAQRPLTRRFDVFLDLRPNKRLRKQSWGWWFETLSRPLWRHRNVMNVTWHCWRCTPMWCLLNAWGCFTNVSRALQNIPSKFVSCRNHTFEKNSKLTICTWAQSHALSSTHTQFQFDILTVNVISSNVYFARLFWRAREA